MAKMTYIFGLFIGFYGLRVNFLERELGYCLHTEFLLFFCLFILLLESEGKHQVNNVRFLSLFVAVMATRSSRLVSLLSLSLRIFRYCLVVNGHSVITCKFLLELPRICSYG